MSSRYRSWETSARASRMQAALWTRAFTYWSFPKACALQMSACIRFKEEPAFSGENYERRPCRSISEESANCERGRENGSAPIVFRSTSASQFLSTPIERRPTPRASWNRRSANSAKASILQLEFVISATAGAWSAARLPAARQILQHWPDYLLQFTELLQVRYEHSVE